jgi:hypothetical protein
MATGTKYYQIMNLFRLRNPTKADTTIEMTITTTMIAASATATLYAGHEQSSRRRTIGVEKAFTLINP